MGLESQLAGTFVGTRFSDALNWARKYSLFQYPFVTACCAMAATADMATPASARASVFKRM